MFAGPKALPVRYNRFNYLGHVIGNDGVCASATAILSHRESQQHSGHQSNL